MVVAGNLKDSKLHVCVIVGKKQQSIRRKSLASDCWVPAIIGFSCDILFFCMQRFADLLGTFEYEYFVSNETTAGSKFKVLFVPLTVYCIAWFNALICTPIMVFFYILMNHLGLFLQLAVLRSAMVPFLLCFANFSRVN